MAIGDFRKAAKASLLGARMVTFMALERVEVIAGWVLRIAANEERELVDPRSEFKLWASEEAEKERRRGIEILGESMMKNDKIVSSGDDGDDG